VSLCIEEVQTRRSELLELNNEALMEAGYKFVIKLGPTTPDGIELRAVLMALDTRMRANENPST